MPTLTINVNYDSKNKSFFYFLSYTGPDKVVWLSTINDGGIIQFIKDGELRLTNNDSGKNRSKAFQFDAVRVQLGHTLTGLASLQCGSDEPFDLSTIPFPTLTGDKPAIVAVSWCQVCSSSGGDKSLILQDPKLGLSNTKGDVGAAIDESNWDKCTCSKGKQAD
ncbi:MAG TPA: hypothetical protein VK034_10025 [Enhygromyxa sp.]|nr:hypothetical protein [Enhygromyxa sp.]